jgi:hypothetical protein
MDKIHLLVKRGGWIAQLGMLLSLLVVITTHIFHLAQNSLLAIYYF